MELFLFVIFYAAGGLATVAYDANQDPESEDQVALFLMWPFVICVALLAYVLFSVSEYAASLGRLK